MLFFLIVYGWSKHEYIPPALSGLDVRVLEVSTSDERSERHAASQSHSPKKNKQSSDRALRQKHKATDTASDTSTSASTSLSSPLSGASSNNALVTGARFDVAYLRNAKPAYPAASRRHGEEGKVVLRVLVSQGGLPLKIEFRQKSGFPRLDLAAQTAVEKWRFIAARQGGQNIEAWVLVPLIFKLDH